MNLLQRYEDVLNGTCVSACLARVARWASHEELRALTYARSTLLHIVLLWHDAIATPAAR